jgi:hypothetical protein
VRHVAIPARSVNDPKRAYTTPGLGDRIHSCIVGWLHGPPVTLHLDKTKIQGGRFGNKPESWKEIVSLFPAGSLHIRVHDIEPSTERGWLEYLYSKGLEIEPYFYGDYPGPFESQSGYDISARFKSIPLLTGKSYIASLPKRFVTVQWDANGKARSISGGDQGRILRRYAQDGLEAVVVGGEAKTDELRWSLKHIASAMLKAEAHVGVDSGFFHMAQLYMPWERIHLYNLPGGFHSHHALRARDNGAKINLYL